MTVHHTRLRPLERPPEISPPRAGPAAGACAHPDGAGRRAGRAGRPVTHDRGRQDRAASPPAPRLRGLHDAQRENNDLVPHAPAGERVPVLLHGLDDLGRRLRRRSAPARRPAGSRRRSRPASFCEATRPSLVEDQGLAGGQRDLLGEHLRLGGDAERDAAPAVNRTPPSELSSAAGGAPRWPA